MDRSLTVEEQRELLKDLNLALVRDQGNGVIVEDPEDTRDSHGISAFKKSSNGTGVNSVAQKRDSIP